MLRTSAHLQYSADVQLNCSSVLSQTVKSTSAVLEINFSYRTSQLHFTIISVIFKPVWSLNRYPVFSTIVCVMRCNEKVARFNPHTLEDLQNAIHYKDINHLLLKTRKETEKRHQLNQIGYFRRDLYSNLNHFLFIGKPTNGQNIRKIIILIVVFYMNLGT